MDIMSYGKDSIKDALGLSTAIGPKMKQAIRNWYKAYMNDSTWLNKDVKSLNLAATISSEIARLVTIENEIEITGSPRADFIRKQLDYFDINKKIIVELASATGGVVFKPYVSNGMIEIDFVYQDEIIPFRFDGNGEITGIIFPSYSFSGNRKFTRLEIHDFKDGVYRIQNKCFVSKDTYINTNEIRNLGSEVSLTSVDEWKGIVPDVTISGINAPWFSFFRIPIANNIDRKSPLGVSVYARGIEDIRKADIQAMRYDWEFESKETAIETEEDYLSTDIYGTRNLPKGKERMYRLYHKESYNGEQPLFKHFSPDIRDESFARGMDKYFKRIEFNCGLAYGTISDPQNVDKTAEEIKSSKQRSYQLVKDIQGSLEKSIIRLIDIIDDMATAYQLAPLGEYTTSFVWDDSIIVDAEKERMQDLQEVRDGLLPEWKYKVKWQGMTETQAKAELSSNKGITFGDE